jgi:FlaA1/EpsC-like NDP-sugar epimerase
MTVKPLRHPRAERAAGWLFGVAVSAFAFWAAWMLRFEFVIPAEEMRCFRISLGLILAIKGLVFLRFDPGVNRWCHYSGFADLTQLLKINLLASALSVSAVIAVLGLHFPRTVHCLDFMLCTLTCAAIRFSARLYHEEFAGRRPAPSWKNLLVYGAGLAGLGLAREIRHNPRLGYRVAGFLDDDPGKQGATFLGIPVMGSGDDARGVAERLRTRNMPVHEIVVSMYSASGTELRGALRKAATAGVPCRIVPGLGELISGKLRTGNGNDIAVTDLLGRERVQLDAEQVRRSVAGKVVLVTGAAGSIGTELCAQLAALDPATLIALDQAESDMFRLEADLRERFPNLHLETEIADIRDARTIESILEHYGVDAIYHAAAYKHVPIMEHHVCEAVRNNVIGTWILAQAAWRMNVSRFLLISTDKAVNPSSIMGLTKRISELLVCAERPVIGRERPTRFVCVRFGNVLVSNGSVVPLFQKQIGKGGPITITHPEVCRYFMTVQEAVQLVLMAPTMGKGSQIFVLDMGKPIRILELAQRLIRLNGLVPDKDIEIRFVGLRPGEKLFEEISFNDENHLPTSHEKIRVFQSRAIAFETLAPWIAELEHHLWREDPQAVLEQLKELVPEYQPYIDAPVLQAETAVGQQRAGYQQELTPALAIPQNRHEADLLV